MRISGSRNDSHLRKFERQEPENRGSCLCVTRRFGVYPGVPVYWPQSVCSSVVFRVSSEVH
jgi:hypothetical protein